MGQDEAAARRAIDAGLEFEGFNGKNSAKVKEFLAAAIRSSALSRSGSPSRIPNPTGYRSRSRWNWKSNRRQPENSRLLSDRSTASRITGALRRNLTRVTAIGVRPRGNTDIR